MVDKWENLRVEKKVNQMDKTMAVKTVGMMGVLWAMCSAGRLVVRMAVSSDTLSVDYSVVTMVEWMVKPSARM